MLACVLKNRLSSRFVTRSVAAFFGRRAFSENAESVEYEIVKNMETFPLFSQKIDVETCPFEFIVVCGKEGN